MAYEKKSLFKSRSAPKNQPFLMLILFQVSLAMGLLTAAKFGLTDTEMLDLLAFMDVFHSTDTYGKFLSIKVGQ